MSYIGNPPLNTAFLTDTFTGNGSTTAFTMSVAPANTASVLVSVSGVLQTPSTYSVNGTTLTFSSAPPAGTGNISVRYLGIPASGVTTTAYRTQTEFTATAGQTTFTPPSYTVGFIDVYRNGVKLGTADFTASNGTTVVLATGATAGDLVTTVSFLVSSVLNAIPNTAGQITGTNLVSGISIASPTLTSPTFVTPASSVITNGTTVATTSGTAVNFTGIPSWVKRITIMLAGTVLSSSANRLFQLGSGSYQTTGYQSQGCYLGSGTNSASATNGFQLFGDGTSSYNTSGMITFTLLNPATNLWVGSGVFSCYQNVGLTVSGYVTLSGTLDRVRIYTTSGTDTFTAGSANILYE